MRSACLPGCGFPHNHDLRYLCTRSHPQYGQLRQSVRIGQKPVLRSGGGGSTFCQTFPAARAATLTTSKRPGRIAKRTCLFTSTPFASRAINPRRPIPDFRPGHVCVSMKECSLRDKCFGNVRLRSRRRPFGRRRLPYRGGHKSDPGCLSGR